MGPLSVAIIGAGLIGTSVALATRRAWPAATLVTIDRGDSLEPARGADIIVLAAPVDAIIDLLRHHGPALREAVVLDTGSTKRAIVAAARDAGLETFVGGHPLAGAASHGPGAARADLFDGRPWFLIEPDHPHALDRARTFVVALGATPVIFGDDGTAHDRLMAAVSHLPQVTASALMSVVGAAVGESGLEWAGSGLQDTTRLAASQASIWESILATNADAVAPLLQSLADELRDIAERLEEPGAVPQLFARANRYREVLRDRTR
jgi:prephenate dehydrogenase